MLQPFLITLRETIQCSVVIVVVLILPEIRDNRGYRKALIFGAGAALILGVLAGHFPSLGRRLPAAETWTTWRYAFELMVFYLSIFFAIINLRAAPLALSTGLFSIGFIAFFFEARASAFLLHDMAVMKGNIPAVIASGIAGAGSGFGVVIFLSRFFKKIPVHTVFTPSSVFMSIGALKFLTGGVGELEKTDILIFLQRGIQNFLESAVGHLRQLLMLTEHPFIDVPFDGLAGYLSEDRTAMALMVVFIMSPPLFILIDLFARAEPVVDTAEVGAQKRLKISFFRKEIFLKTIPVMAALIILIISIHAVNISLNPLYEPVPRPVGEEDGAGIVKILFSDRSGDITDGKLRKYVYYYGNKQIIFLVILKPDGSLGAALDQCEICRPAEWNKSAQGYAQRGNTVVCKYCMTPIPLSTINNPGGCNPIPLSFRVEEKTIIIALGDLINTFRAAEALDKKGMHL